MEDIYRETATATENGVNFRIDSQSGSLKVNGRHTIRNGGYDGVLRLPEYGYGNSFTDAEELYRRHKHSIPPKHSQSRSRRYFMALPESGFKDEDMLYGRYRDTAQLELKFYTLCRTTGGLTWSPKTMGRWFWQNEEDKDLVILRKWAEPGSDQLLTNPQ